MIEIALIACCKSKAPLAEGVAVPAAQLYQGLLFRTQFRYARAVLGLPEEHIFVLSARYGLVRMQDHLASYEATLGQFSAVQRRAWGEAVVQALAQHVSIDADLCVHLLGGKFYREVVEAPLRAMGAECLRPVQRLGYGAQVRWYQQALAGREIQS